MTHPPAPAAAEPDATGVATDTWLIGFVDASGEKKTQTLAGGRLSLTRDWAMVLSGGRVVAAVPAQRVLEVRRSNPGTEITIDEWLIELVDASGEKKTQTLAGGRLSLKSEWAMVLSGSGVVAAVPLRRVLEVRRLSHGGDAWRAA